MEGFLLNEQTWLQHLKEKRLAYGLSQNRLAVATGITRQYLSDIETGKVKPSEDLQQSLWEALERFNPDAPLEMLFDYVRIRFPTTDVQQVVENILQLKLSYFLHEDYGFYSYSEHYALGDIFVLCSHELDKGVLVELKGRGCRQFESYLLAQQRSWYEFFMDVLVAGGVMKRLDLAINDKTGILNIPVLTEKCQQEECISVFRSFKSYRSGELVRKEEKECMGNTLYIGSLQSEVYFCIYEKDYEQYKKNDIPIEDAEVKNRFEIRLKNERAYYAVRDLLVYDNPEHTAFKIINRYIRFVDKDDSKPRSDWKLNEEWAWFIGNNRERLKLTTKPEPYSFQRTLNWLSHQVAPTLKVAIKLDEINQTQVVKDILDHAKLTDRHKQILKQQAVIVDPKAERGRWKETLPEISHEINIVTLTSDEKNKGLLDPYVIMKNPKDSESLAIDILTFLTGISSRDGERFPILRKAIRAVTNSEVRGLMKVIEELRVENTPLSTSIADHIESFTDYDFAHLLFSNGYVEQSISLEKQLNIIQVADLVLPDKETSFEEYTTMELLSVAMLIVISTFALDFIHTDRSIFKIVDLDEAWSFLQVAQGKTLSMKLVRAGRAMNAGVYFVTQNTDDLLDEKLKNNLGLKFAFRSTDLNEIKKTLAFFGVDPEDENNQKRLRDLENGQCLISDLYGRVGVIQFHPVFEELLHAFDTRPPVRKEV